MIKLLHLISGGDTGGAKTHLFSLMKGLQGHVDARIICFIRGSFYEDAKALGIPIQVVEQKSRFDLGAMDGVVEDIKREGYDLVHCHGARANFNALFIRNKIETPMLTTLHSDYRLDFKDSLAKNLIFTPLNGFALKRFNYYIAITQNFKDMMVERGFPKDQIFVGYNGLDFSREETYLSREDFLARHQLEAYRDQVLVGMAARLDLVKDHRSLIEAISQVGDLLRGRVHFILAGQGPERDYLNQRVQEEDLSDVVSFIGQIRDPFSLFNAVDLNLLTSKSESFPYALLEGAKMKKPFISSDVGGIREMAGDSKGALFFPPGDSQALAQVLVKIQEDPQALEAMGQRLYDHVKEHFSSEAMSATHEKIYGEILKREGRSYES
ncbi:MAG: glycosyltransferase [Tissierellia bacterium]|nr:glycosyltransferase [Tissierellia bacterium]